MLHTRPPFFSLDSSFPDPPKVGPLHSPSSSLVFPQSTSPAHNPISYYLPPIKDHKGQRQGPASAGLRAVRVDARPCPDIPAFQSNSTATLTPPHPPPPITPLLQAWGATRTEPPQKGPHRAALLDSTLPSCTGRALDRDQRSWPWSRSGLGLTCLHQAHQLCQPQEMRGSADCERFNN